MAYDTSTGLRTMTFVIEGEIDTQITLTEMADGSLKVDVLLLDGALIGDMRGLFFDAPTSLIEAGMTITGDDLTGQVTDEDGVKSVSKSVNIKGEVLSTYGAFDVGLEFGTNGISKDDIRSTSFTISSTDPVTIDMFEESDFALRYTSVGEEGGSRDDSLKIGGTSESLGSIGDRVWIDADFDGIQGADEAGLAGAVVTLWKNGVDSGLTAVTDADGYYLFDFLEAADYSIVVSALPENYVFTLQDAGADEAADSDVDAGGASGVIALAEGQDVTSLDAGVYDLTTMIDPPELLDDDACTCWTEAPTLSVLSNDEPGVTITAVEGIALTPGGAVTLASGATVTLNADGTLTYDGVDAWAGLEFGGMGVDVFTYTAANEYGMESTASVSMTVHATNIKTLEDVEAIKPDSVEVFVTVQGDGFVVDVASPQNERFSATASTDIYCVDFFGDVPDGILVTAEVFLADANNAALGEFVQNWENLDLVNWILNQDFVSQGYTAQEVQQAIWNLTDDLFISFYPGASEIAAQARAEGEGFEAGEGDLVGLVLAPIEEVDANGVEITNHQNLIYGVEYESFSDCLCM
ncbi:SdrD B-like domain-containing protein [Rhodovulum sp. DZ06]|uniref:SdrD B-like domain-containing protein n=1 Tax=Rhodovulum sp. DZ06 TaxID=3425126 RepID=UPI003D34A331